MGELALVRTTSRQREVEEGSKVPLDYLVVVVLGPESFRVPKGADCGLRPDNLPPAANRPRQSCAFRARD